LELIRQKNSADSLCWPNLYLFILKHIMTFQRLSIPVLYIKITHVQTSILKDDTHSLHFSLEMLKFSDNGD